jgi:hypothetical protein
MTSRSGRARQASQIGTGPAGGRLSRPRPPDSGHGEPAASDQPGTRLYIYACPGRQRGPLARLLADYGLVPESGTGRTLDGQLSLHVPYVGRHAHAGLAGELTDHIILTCPGVSFAACERPVSGSPGGFHAYTPALGRYSGSRRRGASPRRALRG